MLAPSCHRPAIYHYDCYASVLVRYCVFGLSICPYRHPSVPPILVSLPILVSSVVSLYFLEWTDVFKPVKSGFNCHDRSLSLPYIDPNHEVIPLLMLLSLAFAGPAITVRIHDKTQNTAFILRFHILIHMCRPARWFGAEANINAAGCNFNSFIRRAVRFVGVHAFGLCATALITDILQLMTGYPAPYFLTVCKPNYTTLNVSCEQNPYIMEDISKAAECAASIINRLSDSQDMYFNSTLTDSSKLLKPLLVFSFIISAIICGLTRIIQYKNHAADVYLGFLLGGAIAVYLVRVIPICSLPSNVFFLYRRAVWSMCCVQKMYIWV
uniref:Phospholipid phosphatase related 4b n=1 Tax=Stegastes partitus TaxID=144197 RepID=A0A3B4ZXN5_9TELE